MTPFMPPPGRRNFALSDSSAAAPAEPDRQVAATRGTSHVNRPNPRRGRAARPPHLDAGRRPVRDQRGGEPAVVAGADGEHVRPVRHDAAGSRGIAGRGQPARDDHLDVSATRLHLLQDVRAEQTVRPSAAIARTRLHHVQALPGVHAVERLVEQQDLRLVQRGPPPPWRAAHALEYVSIRRSLASGQLDRGEARRAASSGRDSSCSRALDEDQLQPVR